jgi:aldehyde dehydrogenase (NAD+)
LISLVTRKEILITIDTHGLTTEDFRQVRHVFDIQRDHRWITKQTTAQERQAVLERLRAEVVASFDEVIAALHADLGRPSSLSKAEIRAVIHDIDDAITNLDEWMAATPVTPAPYFGRGARAEVRYEARGVVLLFGPWNFPFGLVFEPLVPIIAAGNTCIVKPNELAPATSAVTARIISAVFDDKHVAVFEGGIDLANALLDMPVDHIFFTGSPAVGRVVMSKAAAHLASVTLELGGKCPAVVDATADLSQAVQNIAVGKHQNAGQICLSPDHVWVHEDVRDEFIDGYLGWVSANLCDGDQVDAKRLGRLINQRNFDRVQGYVQDAVRQGATSLPAAPGTPDDLVVVPTVLTGVDMNAAVMREEIFGPIMPVLTYRDLPTVVDALRQQGKPLAMYIFSANDAFVEKLLAQTSSGGATVNGWALHSTETALPFGGVGASGIGRYHGIHGFHELSHARSILVAAPDRI